MNYTGGNKRINWDSVDRNSFSVSRVNGTNSDSVFLLPYDLFGTGVDVNLGIFSTNIRRISEDYIKRLGYILSMDIV